MTFLILALIACAVALLVLALKWPGRPPVDFVPNRAPKDRRECEHYLRVTLDEGGEDVRLLFTQREFLVAKDRARKQPEDFQK